MSRLNTLPHKLKQVNVVNTVKECNWLHLLKYFTYFQQPLHFLSIYIICYFKLFFLYMLEATIVLFENSIY